MPPQPSAEAAPSSVPTTDPGTEFLRGVVSGATFADVGGLIGVQGEKLSVARQLGATGVTMIDVVAPTDPAWMQLRERLERFGVGQYECISGDVYDLELEPFDVVYCSSVLQHIADPVGYLSRLRSLTRGHLVLTCAILPPRIVNRYGVLRVSGAGPLFVPAMTDRQKRIYAHFHTRGDARLELVGITTEAERWRTNYAAWWWLLPVQTVRSMATASGFEVVADAPDWYGRGHTFLLRNSGRRDCLPSG